MPFTFFSRLDIFLKIHSEPEWLALRNHGEKRSEVGLPHAGTNSVDRDKDFVVSPVENL